jgi:hypothetical protein
LPIIKVHAGFSLGLLLDPEDGSDIFLQNWLDPQPATLPYSPEESALPFKYVSASLME